MKYKNPIIRGFHPDPSVCKAEEGYFLVTSSFEYLPGVPLFHSKDLINWKQIGHCLTRPSQIDLKNSKCSGGIFAPTIRYHEGTFYMITTNIAKGNFLVTTKDPFGQWSDPIWINRMGIDPSLYWEDGKTYMQLATRDEEGLNAIEQFEIDVATGEIVGECNIISRGCGGRDVEGPHMYKINNTYYLMVAEGGTREGHMVTVMKSNSLWGPFEPCPYNPILSNRDYGREALQSVGHGDLIEDNSGNWWMVALATRPVKHKHVLGRETILMPVIWTEDGWPMVKDRCALSEVEVEELNGEISETDNCVKDDFEVTSLAPCYSMMREFINDKYSLTERKGWLCLNGDKYTLNDLEASAFIGRRQEEYDFVAETKIDFKPTAPNEEAGLVIYLDNEHHMEFVLTIRSGEKAVILRKNVADIKIETEWVKLDKEAEEIYLCIKGDKREYHFYCGTTKENMKLVGSTMVKHLAIEGANSAFTGTFIGMYASGNGKDMHTKAYFDYLGIENKHI
ncbi:glycoside hydrolase family 43 protein [Clostridium folliculivorans]|uniref:Glycoside hydrolase 43 family protein n=1 Tax=Clostridium folliculivorans TaxID=2886038 RepID=A0A9W5Y4P9_9CLOT|nr:glycoside hydrolase family 43 protein [Clostridium folliculivorans]GKU26621.1 glycoside hydrolase 43 family protein [Clostridium folliculivorans]GKU28947.1 glycoside hydrolase 43 family protein [Clostridium folliculivorans]